jgi:hypothetical protein
MKWISFEAEDGEFYELELDDATANCLIPVVNSLHRISIWDTSAGIYRAAFPRKE